MSDPIALPADMWTRLGETGDDERAAALIADAQALCEAEVSPLPAAAKTIVLRSAIRAYVTLPGVSQEISGPYTVTYRDAYLTADEKRTLRRMAGKGRAFYVDPSPASGVGEDLPWWDVDGADPYTFCDWLWDL